MCYSIDNLEFPQKGGGVREEGERLVDDMAWSAGIWTAGWVSIGNILTAPPDAGVWFWLVGLIITGLFGLASTATAVVLKHFLDARRMKRDRESERLESGTDRGPLR
jgi:hypothetical protein